MEKYYVSKFNNLSKKKELINNSLQILIAKREKLNSFKETVP